MRHLDFDRAVDRAASGEGTASLPGFKRVRPYVAPAFHKQHRPLPPEMQRVLDELAAKDDARRRAALASAWKPETVRRGR